MSVAEHEVVEGRSHRLPAGHAYLQPEMVVAVKTKPGERVAYRDETNNGCSRIAYFRRGADHHPASGGNP